MIPPGLLASPTRIALLGLGLALAASLAGNWFLWGSRDRALERAAAAEQARAQWEASAAACSAATDKLLAAADARAREVAQAIKRAEAIARAADARAQKTLGEAPAVPGDACASARSLNARKIAERRAAAAGGGKP